MDVKITIKRFKDSQLQRFQAAKAKVKRFYNEHSDIVDFALFVGSIALINGAAKVYTNKVNKK